MDSTGNRVAGMIVSPKNVIVLAGANKVVDTPEDALKRLKQIGFEIRSLIKITKGID